MASRPAPCRSSRAWRLAAGLGHAEQQVLGRDEVVAKPAGLGLGPLDDGLGPRVERERAALDPGPLGEDRRELAAERRQVDAEPAQRLGGDAVIGFDEGGQQVFGVEDRALESLGRRLGGDDGLLGLLGESIELHRGSLFGAPVDVGQRGSGCLTRSRKARAAAFASSDRSVGRTIRAFA